MAVTFDANAKKLTITTIQLKRGTLAALEALDTPLAEGEKAVVTDGANKGRTKTGDGNTLFSLLKYDDEISLDSSTKIAEWDSEQSSLTVTNSASTKAPSIANVIEGINSLKSYTDDKLNDIDTHVADGVLGNTAREDVKESDFTNEKNNAVSAGDFSKTAASLQDMIDAAKRIVALESIVTIDGGVVGGAQQSNSGD